MSGVRRCPNCGAVMVVLAASNMRGAEWQGWHCNRCQHEEQVRVTREGKPVDGREMPWQTRG